MRTNQLGRSTLTVSDICLGSMTWGSQNSIDEAHAQIDMALDSGVNFIDTAEMYPTTPGTPENVHRTEEIIGNWFAATKRRSDVVIATKITGPGAARVRDGVPITGVEITRALDASLQRLKTDQIDLYQLHWANRGSYHMRQNWAYTPSRQSKDQMDAHVLDVLTALQVAKNAGKIREVGLSNETAWGSMKFLQASENHDLPRVVSIQNEYSLLCRHFDLDLAELAHHEDLGLLAWSPLAAGLLSDKYAGDVTVPGSRRALQGQLNGRMTDRSVAATSAYANLARQNDMTPAQMALAFCRSRPFVASTIIGATTPDQLAENLQAAEITLSDEVQNAIGDLHRRFATPM